MKRTERSPLGYYTVGIAALFIAGFFLLVLFGAVTYRNTVGSQTDNYGTRSLLSYIPTAVRSNDSMGGIEIADTEYGQALIINDGESGYATRIYLYNGSLVEDFAAAGSDLMPDSAQIIGASDTFSVSQVKDGLYSVSTDAGTVLVGERSEG